MPTSRHKSGGRRLVCAGAKLSDTQVTVDALWFLQARCRSSRAAEQQSSVSVRTSSVIVRVVYFPSMFAALRMGDQRAISALTKPLNFAGVRSPLLGSDPPRSASRA
jgi:hypothetical protein